MCKIRLYVYTARDLTARASGDEPQPFLKIFNGTEAHQIRTTRDKPVGSTLNPDFYSSFELSAYLPGQSQLHVQASQTSATSPYLDLPVHASACAYKSTLMARLLLPSPSPQIR